MLENNMRDFIKVLCEENIEKVFEGDVCIYTISNSQYTLRYWNDSNHNKISREALKDIRGLVAEGDEDGSVCDDWNDIAFEVIRN